MTFGNRLQDVMGQVEAAAQQRQDVPIYQRMGRTMSGLAGDKPGGAQEMPQIPGASPEQAFYGPMDQAKRMALLQAMVGRSRAGVGGQ